MNTESELTMVQDNIACKPATRRKWHRLTQASRRGSHRIASMLIVASILVIGVWLGPVAQAENTTNLRDAVVAGRGETSCEALRYNDVVGDVAERINKSTDDYVNHLATRVPIADPLEGLKELGYGGTRGYLLQGAHEIAASAIRGALLQGYAAIPDCSYTDFGVSLVRNNTTGYFLAVVVLAGP